MLYVSLNPDILSYILLKDDAGSIVENTGNIPVPFTLNRTFFTENDAVRSLSGLFRTLKKHLENPFKEVFLSLCPNLLTYSFAQDDTPVWADEIRLGSDYASTLMRRNYETGSGNFTVWYNRNVINKITEAARFEGFDLVKVTPGIINAYNIVHEIYATEQYQLYSILKWDKNYSEILFLRNENIIGYACFRKVDDKILLLSKSGTFDNDLLSLLNPASFDERIYDYTGPIFLYATQKLDPDPLQTFKSYGFCEIINPFTGLETMNPEDEEMSGISETLLSLWTESAGFINRG